ncbi:ankyrin repeat domain-containing protein [Pseudonocardia humida]|uniref:Ankyrin repeat domain-containing protein n=1 Tax=Pseudonocardia humida TaxID=2800819 RepID=A0ABT1A1G3_9PSEU|nr:ankyrin repeat domain-containing protein [Pseudonocardia humida]MCO1656845.1 ankyrin repeat domain-containing protein [Pseudonocardia humida]
MPMLHFPEDPSLEHLRGQARALLRKVRAGDEQAVTLLAEHHPRAPAAPRLADAQLALARAYGFTSWPDLRRHLDAVAARTRSPHKVPAPDGTAPDPATELLRLGCLRYGGDSLLDHARATAMLAADPALGGASIHAAAATGDLPATERLLAADPAAATRSGGPFDWVPLLYLAYSRIDAPGADPLGVARLLLRHGADPDSGYLWGGICAFTALTGAFGGGEDGANQPPHRHAAALARLLLEAGADPNDAQALYNRQFGPDDAHLRLLIEFGLGREGGGPWHALLRAQGAPRALLEDQLSVAAEHDRPEWARLALDAGAHPDGLGTRHPIRHGATPYRLAIARGNLRVAELLRAAGATVPPTDPVDDLLTALLAGNRATALAADAPLLAAARARRPDAVRTAAEVGRREAVRLLAELGFDLHPAGDATPLHQAAHAGDAAMVDLLLELGADPARRDTRFDATPLDWAEHNHQDATAALLRGR